MVFIAYTFLYDENDYAFSLGDIYWKWDLLSMKFCLMCDDNRISVIKNWLKISIGVVSHQEFDESNESSWKRFYGAVLDDFRFGCFLGTFWGGRFFVNRCEPEPFWTGIGMNRNRHEPEPIFD